MRKRVAKSVWRRTMTNRCRFNFDRFWRAAVKYEPPIISWMLAILGYEATKARLRGASDGKLTGRT